MERLDEYLRHGRRLQPLWDVGSIDAWVSIASQWADGSRDQKSEAFSQRSMASKNAWPPQKPLKLSSKQILRKLEILPSNQSAKKQSTGPKPLAPASMLSPARRPAISNIGTVKDLLSPFEEFCDEQPAANCRR